MNHMKELDAINILAERVRALMDSTEEFSVVEQFDPDTAGRVEHSILALQTEFQRLALDVRISELSAERVIKQLQES